MLFCIAAQHAACFTGMPLAAHLLKKVRYSTAVHPPPSSGGIRGCKSALSMSACRGHRGYIRGVGRMLFWNPDQNNAHRFSGFQPEARLRATLGQDAPHGLGVSDPSPCAPPRQAGRLGPIGHPVPFAAHFSKKVRYSTAVHPPPSSGGIRGCKSALSMSACRGARGSLRGVAP